MDIKNIEITAKRQLFRNNVPPLANTAGWLNNILI